MFVMDAGTVLSIDLIKEIGIGALFIKEPPDNSNAIHQ
jgi:hypothetical protein